MGIVAIDSNVVRSQSGSGAKKGFGVDDFSATMLAIAPGAAEAVAQSSGSNSAAVTHAAITGVAGASQGYGYSGAYGGGVSAASYPIEPVPGTTGVGGVGGLPPSQSFQEGSALLQAMNDSNMKMLTLQSAVQDVNREFTVLSNVLQSKHQTEINAVRNMRVG